MSVASTPEAADSLARLQAAGRLPVPVQLIELGLDGGPVSGPAQGVRVLWRRSGGGPSSWLLAAADALPDLAWVHSDNVGVDRLPVAGLAARGIRLTNGRGNYSRPMAEWVLLAMLAAVKRFPDFVRRSDARVWEPSPTLEELEGKVLLLIGVGSVGREVARLASAFGMEVRAVARAEQAAPPGTSRLAVGEAWRAELPEADFLVLAAPLTDKTRGMVDRAAFATLKPTCWLVNVARGGLVEERALAEALDAGRIGGALLDTFAEEPLPASSPLWGRPNVVAVPHHTGSSSRSSVRHEQLFAEELGRFLDDRPFANLVDPELGY